MSHSYEMTITITNHDQCKRVDIFDALEDQEVDISEPSIWNENQPSEMIGFPPQTVNLTISSPPEDYAKDIREAVWKANGAFCYVTVGMRDLDEEHPVYEGDEDEYKRWVAKVNPGLSP